MKTTHTKFEVLGFSSNGNIGNDFLSNLINFFNKRPCIKPLVSIDNNIRTLTFRGATPPTRHFVKYHSSTGMTNGPIRLNRASKNSNRGCF